MDTHPEWSTLMLLDPAIPPPHQLAVPLSLDCYSLNGPFRGLRYKTFLCTIKAQSLGPSEGVSQLVTASQAHHT